MMPWAAETTLNIRPVEPQSSASDDELHQLESEPPPRRYPNTTAIRFMHKYGADLPSSHSTGTFLSAPPLKKYNRLFLLD